MKRGVLWFVVVADIALAALFVPLAIDNFARRNDPQSDVPAVYNIFYLCLSTITPLLLLSAAAMLARIVVCKQAPGQTALVLHRLAFWAIFLRAAGQVVLSLFVPNESFNATLAFITGVAFLFPAGLALINAVFLKRQNTV